MKQKQEQEPPVSEAYRNLVELLITFTNASILLAELQGETDHEALGIIRERATEYSDLQVCIADTTAALETLCRLHPEWFLDKQSVKTPAGSVQFRNTPVLDVVNKEVTLALLDAAGDEDPRFRLCIRTEKSLDLEVLETLDDAELKRFRVKRGLSSSFTVKPAKVDLGKAISSADQAEAKEMLA